MRTALSKFAAWAAPRLPVPLLNKFASEPSIIPSFVFDTDHPWIVQNRWALEQVDAAGALCNSDSPLRDSLPPIPAGLFQRINVYGNPRYQGSAGWQKAQLRVQEMLECPLALETCEYLFIDIFPYSGSRHDDQEAEMPPDDLPHQLVDAMHAMPILDTIKWTRHSEAVAASYFQQVFAESGISLPSVKTMHLGSYMEFLVSIAPGLENLVTSHTAEWPSLEPDPRKGLMPAIKGAHRLSNLTTDDIWTPEMVDVLFESAPQLEKLNLQGIQSTNMFDDDPTATPALSQILSKLAKFPRLAELRLPDSSGLDLGFDGGSPCGNAYFGLQGTFYGRKVHRQALSTIETAAEMVFAALPQLETVCIWRQCVRLEPDGSLQWPWTGRMKEYLLESTPRYDQLDFQSGEDDMLENHEGPLFGTWEMDEEMLDEGWRMQTVDFEADYDFGIIGDEDIDA